MIAALLFLLGCADGAPGCDQAFGRDADGDGWGGPDDVVAACAPPEGYAPGVADCDDDDPGVNPGAAEGCDGVDNDCDGAVDDDDPDVTGGAAWFVDADGDGFGGEATVTACARPADATTIGGDCDDAARAVNPAALEACDGVDNDCNGLVDDADPALALAPSWYVDADGDTWGDPATEQLACEGPEGWVDQGGDCDDQDPARSPGATEVCDGEDDDCDGLVDDDDPDLEAATWYGDTDGDGHGYPGDDVTACVAPDGAVAVGDDCDDTDPSRHPGAEETCGDGIDQDCDGADATCG